MENFIFREVFALQDCSQIQAIAVDFEYDTVTRIRPFNFYAHFSSFMSLFQCKICEFSWVFTPLSAIMVYPGPGGGLTALP